MISTLKNTHHTAHTNVFPIIPVFQKMFSLPQLSQLRAPEVWNGKLSISKLLWMH